MSSNQTTLKSLRSAVSDRQRSILDEVWGHVRDKHVGLPERPLLEKFGNAALKEDVGKLGGTIIFSNHEDNKLRYNVGVVGIFLTSEGPRLQKLVERYLIALKDAYERDRDIERFSSKDLSKWNSDFTPLELNELRHILYKAHGSLASSIAGWNAEEWYGSVDDEVVELKNIRNWDAYIETAIVKWYDASQPSGEAERISYTSKSIRDPIWNAIRQTEMLSGLHPVSPLRSRARPPKSAPVGRTRKLNLSFIRNDAPLKLILEDDWKEACQHFKTKAWKSCVLLCGGIVEGLLLWQLETVQKDLAVDAKAGKVDIRYDGEMLSGVIRKSKEQGLIGEDT